VSANPPTEPADGSVTAEGNPGKPPPRNQGLEKFKAKPEHAAPVPHCVEILIANDTYIWLT